MSWIIAIVVVLVIGAVWGFAESKYSTLNSTSQKKILIMAGVPLAGLVLWWMLVGGQRGYTWYGEGTINAFPEGSQSKNYRLDVDEIEAEIVANGIFSNTEAYNLSDANWPNGGILEFASRCTVRKSESTKCRADDGSVYIIEVQDAPSRPEYDSDY